MVTVSCLIVVATLFSQSTTSMPVSSDPTLMDSFFVYLIARLFLICLYHSLLNKRNLKREQQKANDKVEQNLNLSSSSTNGHQFAWPAQTKAPNKRPCRVFGCSFDLLSSRNALIFFTSMDALVISLALFSVVTGNIVY